MSFEIMFLHAKIIYFFINRYMKIRFSKPIYFCVHVYATRFVSCM